MREANQQEEKIEEKLKLIEEDHGNEGYEVVLRVVYLIVKVRPRTVAFSCQVYCPFLKWLTIEILTSEEGMVPKQRRKE